jgi:hypothetical protein
MLNTRASKPAAIAGAVKAQEPMAGRTTITDPVDTAQWSQPGISMLVWGIALATLLPTLVVLLSAWQVRVGHSLLTWFSTCALHQQQQNDDHCCWQPSADCAGSCCDAPMQCLLQVHLNMQ